MKEEGPSPCINIALWLSQPLLQQLLHGFMKWAGLKGVGFIPSVNACLDFSQHF
uniref:Uncharacterized protein n=1 Tax=Arundo donax TaxID=35708 RepID=A0A0A9CFC9_ARUDO